MFNYFAHAGHSHNDENNTETVAEVRSEQPTTADHTPILIGGATFVVIAIVVIAAAFVAGNKRVSKTK